MDRAIRRLVAGLIVAMPFAAELRAEEAADQYAVAAGHYSAERWQLASEEFQAFLKNHAGHEQAPQARFYLAESLVRLGKLSEARQLFAELLESDPQSPLARQALFRKAEASFRVGDDQAASRDLAEFSQQYPHDELNAYALSYLGVLHNNAGRYGEAISAFDSFNARFNDSKLKAQVELARGWSLYKLEKFAEAEGVYKQLVDDREISMEARYRLGMIYAAQQRWQQAIATLGLAAEGDAHHGLQPAIAFQTGESFRGCGELGRAVEQFDKVLSQWPDDGHADDALFGKLQIAIKQEDHATAVRVAEDFLHRFADSSLKVSAECRSAIAVCQARLGNISAAKEALAKLKTAEPASQLIAPTTYKVAEAAFQTGDQATAKMLFGELSSEGNTAEWSSRGLAGLAWSQLKAEDLAASASTFEKLLNQHPDDPLAATAALLRGQALEKLGQFEPALAMYRRVMEDYPQSRELRPAMVRSALLHDKLRQAEDARTLYRQLSELQPPVAELSMVLYQWGCLEADGGQLESACQLWKRAGDDQQATNRVWADARYRLAADALERGKLDECQKLLEALESQKTRISHDLQPFVLCLQGRLAGTQEQWNRVDEPLEKLLAEFPDHPLTSSAMGWIAEATYRRGEYQKAEEQFAKLQLRASGSDDTWTPRASLRRAQSLAQLGQWSKSLEIARSMEKDYPNFASQYEVDYLIGRCLANAADFAGAREAYARVVHSERGGKTETAAMAQWMIGESHFHQEDYAAALRAYLRVEILYAFPKWQAAALVQAGKCYEQLGEWQQASGAYSKLLTTYPNSEVAEEAAKRLGMAQQNLEKRRS